MTTVLHIPAQLDVPIACDMSTAQDTFDERFAEYRRLFERSLTGRERRDDRVVLTFSADARETVEDLVRREAACCPFVDYRVDLAGERLDWTTANPRGDADIDTILDALYELPEHVGAAPDRHRAHRRRMGRARRPRGSPPIRRVAYRHRARRSRRRRGASCGGGGRRPAGCAGPRDMSRSPCSSRLSTVTLGLRWSIADERSTSARRPSARASRSRPRRLCAT